MDNTPTPTQDLAQQPRTKTHIYFLAADVIGGFNAFLAAQRADGDDAAMTLVQFDSGNPFEVLVDAAPIAQVKDLTPASFQPRGSTPLLDATGNLVAHASFGAEQRKIVRKAPESILFVTFTDGEENASRRYTRADVVKLVAAKEAESSTFVFLGAGLDTYAESRGIGYAPGSVQRWAADGRGARVAFDSLARATVAHRGRVRRAEQVDGHEFFDGDKPAEADRQRRGQ